MLGEQDKHNQSSAKLKQPSLLPKDKDCSVYGSTETDIRILGVLQEPQAVL